MTERKEFFAVMIVVVAAAAILVYFAVNAIASVTVLQAQNQAEALPGGGTLAGVDISGWQTYNNPAFGFAFRYPSNWQISTAGLSGTPPVVILGDPLTGTTTYAMYVAIEQNPKSLSSGDFVHAMLAADRATDALNAKSGPSPTVTPQFTHAYLTAAGDTSAYELYDVFEFDHNAEQVYAANGNVVLKFDFPVADDNANLADPANNNAIAHMIMQTLSFEQ